jgi:rare lipoprotein A (peptidoglycan hydrolase)
VSGAASWYCQTGVSACHYQYAGGYYAAAGPALRVGNWRGRAVRVCGGGGCVTVRLIDWCQCHGTRVIDLYSDAFRQIAPLSSGTTRVTVSW